MSVPSINIRVVEYFSKLLNTFSKIFLKEKRSIMVTQDKKNILRVKDFEIRDTDASNISRKSNKNLSVLSPAKTKNC